MTGMPVIARRSNPSAADPPCCMDIDPCVTIHGEITTLRPTPADSLSVSLKRAANTFSLLSVSVSVSSNTPHPTPHAVYDTWGPPAGARARRELRRGERKRGNGECRDTASILRRGMRSLLESAIVPQTVQNADAEWDGECCWSWSYNITACCCLLHLVGARCLCPSCCDSLELCPITGAKPHCNP